MINRIKTYLAVKDISGRALGEEVGVSQQMMHNYLTGACRMPMNVVMRILEKHPDLSAEWLMRNEGEMKRQLGDKHLQSMQKVYEELLSDRDRRIRELEVELARREKGIG